LVSSTDSNHQRAVAISSDILKAHRPVVVPGEIVTETLNVVGKRQGHRDALRIGEVVFSSPEYLIAETTEDIRTAAIEHFRTSANSVSYTDCLVMAFADRYQAEDIFGFDEAFRKSGYHLLEAKAQPRT